MLKDMSMYRYKKILLFFICITYQSIGQVNTSNITIVRDKWGVPHIYGNTDKEAAYGLAWAHAEDDFQTIQKTFLPAKKMLGRLNGIRGAFLDYVVELLRCRSVAKRELQNLPPEGLNVIYGYLGVGARATPRCDFHDAGRFSISFPGPSESGNTLYVNSWRPFSSQ